MTNDLPDKLLDLKAELLSSLLRFTQFFYEVIHKREFIVDLPNGRESPQITLCRYFTKAFNLELSNLLINIEPGSGKSEICKFFIAFAMARYPDSQFIYTSFSHELAAKHTYGIKEIMSHPMYRQLFGVRVRQDSSAKDNFLTEAGGRVYAAGATGTVTGFNAGLPIKDRFSGALIMDDMHNPNEVYSETMRNSVKENYLNTLSTRKRSPVVPSIFIGQRLHQDDLPANLIKNFDGQTWETVILPSLDENSNVLCPRVRPIETLIKLRKYQPYVFAAQCQQDPIPAGGGIFKEGDFITLDDEPNIFATFLTVDTAETANTLNDPSVFSFWGAYKVKQVGVETNLLALHWLDCREIWVEPRDLESELLDFYSNCLRHKIPPIEICIEKKSTGVTLSSTLSQVQGLKITNVERTKASGNKATRYIETQKYAAMHLITLPANAAHTQMCIKHMSQLTDNMTHKHDDIADTYYDAVKIALIDRSLIGLKHQLTETAEEAETADALTATFQKIQSAFKYGSIYH